MFPLQVDWFVDTVPRSLPTWLLVLGLEAMFFGTALDAARDRDAFQGMSDRMQTAAVVALSLGFFFMALSVLRTAYALYAAYLFVLFRVVKGAADLRVYRKLVAVLRTRSLADVSSGHLLTHGAVIVFVLIAGGWLAFGVMTRGPRLRSTWYDLALIYTGVSVAITSVGVRWRLQETDTDYSTGVTLGLMLCIAGADVFDYGTFGAEVAVTMAGVVSYGVGFWGAAFLWLSKGGPDHSGSGAASDLCGHCGTALGTYADPNYCPDCGQKVAP